MKLMFLYKNINRGSSPIDEHTAFIGCQPFLITQYLKVSYFHVITGKISTEKNKTLLAFVIIGSTIIFKMFKQEGAHTSRNSY